MNDSRDPGSVPLEEGTIRILFEGVNFLFIGKPAGVLVHRLKSHPPRPGEVILTDWLLERYPEIARVGDDPEFRPGIVHRLDRDTSGIMVIARNQSAFLYLKHLFGRHEVKKTYLALVFGKPSPESGVIEKPIAIKQGSLKRATRGKKLRLSKEALTRYRTISQYEYHGAPFSLLSVFPETGRTHQIRVHLASIGTPVVGDGLYGSTPRRKEFSRALGLDRQFLHAETIEFTDQTGERIRVSDDLPPSLSRVLDQFLPAPEDRLPGS
ncbi:MAG: RluA family pseudouridine synthase [Patescibacteria group bacterium]